MNIKSGDLIFLIKDETSMQNEHLVEVKEYDCKNNIVKSDKVYTIYKIMPVSYTHLDVYKRQVLWLI